MGRKGCHHLRVQRALERHRQVDDLVLRRPAPGGKFLVMRCQINVLVRPVKAEQKPAHPLAAIPAMPGAADKIGRQVIKIFAGGFGDQDGVIRGDAGLLGQLAPRRPGRVLARITSRGNGANYGWHQVIDNGDGTYFDQPLLPDVPWGTATSGPAWELGGREDVPTDGSVIVELAPGQRPDYL